MNRSKDQNPEESKQLDYAELIAASEIMLGRVSIMDTGYSARRRRPVSSSRKGDIYGLREEHVRLCGKLGHAITHLKNNKKASDLLSLRLDTHVRVIWELERKLNN